MRVIVAILLLSSFAYCRPATTMKCLSGNIGFKQSAAQRVAVDKIVKLSSSAWQMPLVISSVNTVAVGTTPAVYPVFFENVRLKVSDKRISDLISYCTSYIVANDAQLQYYDFRVHNCRLDTDGDCQWELILKK